VAGPLSHIQVLDLSRAVAGLWAAQRLADLGADVVKFERPGEVCAPKRSKSEARVGAALS
jgi:crotonobetainyl-CoA:carnitine CoA-transferase CaiB-like acyl-CoA transferase